MSLSKLRKNTDYDRYIYIPFKILGLGYGEREGFVWWKRSGYLQMTCFIDLCYLGSSYHDPWARWSLKPHLILTLWVSMGWFYNIGIFQIVVPLKICVWWWMYQDHETDQASK